MSKHFLTQTLGGRDQKEIFLKSSCNSYIPWLLVNTFIVEEDLPCFPDVTSNVATGENIVKMLANKCANFTSFLVAEPLVVTTMCFAK